MSAQPDVNLCQPGIAPHRTECIDCRKYLRSGEDWRCPSLARGNGRRRIGKRPCDWLDLILRLQRLHFKFSSFSITTISVSVRHEAFTCDKVWADDSAGEDGIVIHFAASKVNARNVLRQFSRLHTPLLTRVSVNPSPPAGSSHTLISSRAFHFPSQVAAWTHHRENTRSVHARNVLQIGKGSVQSLEVEEDTESIMKETIHRVDVHCFIDTASASSKSYRLQRVQ
ncbi:uncharacterized protein ARMOST_15169 [Armillaria ostoyae]|uniref:Uncharacterized protein n=1 Tax=Armillaria ostoyae TaxID=47428 RepID=A0A284RSP7_ARMOS|nr:uncharacterized protein ARMOST_15169 [Armillaria ostoyae]